MIASPSLRLAKRLEQVSESATLKLNAAVQAMKAQGVDVINLTAGEPDFPVAQAVKEAVHEAVRANRSKYTPAAGIPELRNAIAKKTNQQQPELGQKHGPWKNENVVVTNGGKQAIFNAFLAILDPGDEVLIPAPYWLSYPEMAKIAEGNPRIIKARFDNKFKLTPEELRAAVMASSRPRILVLNSPSNPTGSMYSREEFSRLGEVLSSLPQASQIWVISDEIYDRITFSEAPFCSFLSACPNLRDRTITVNGLSKSAAMTGWRVGWSVAPENVTQAMLTLQGQSTSGINALAQWASLAALSSPEEGIREQVERYRSRAQLALEILRKAGKLRISVPEGAFYLFVGVGNYLRSGEDSVAFSERLLQGAKVAVVAGTPFGEPEFIRLSFATDEASLEEGCRRIVQYLGSS